MQETQKLSINMISYVLQVLYENLLVDAVQPKVRQHLNAASLLESNCIVQLREKS